MNSSGMKIVLSLLLLKNRKLRPGIGSDLLQYIEGIYLSPDIYVTVDCVILDEATIANMLKLNGVLTFQEYADFVFTPFVEQ